MKPERRTSRLRRAGLQGIVACLCASGVVPAEIQAAGLATTTSLTATPAQAALSQAVTLTATVAPPPSDGSKVTFYDGTSILGIAPLATNGTATLTTTQLGSGSRSLQARYWGNGNLSQSASNIMKVAVTAQPGAGFTLGPRSPIPTPLLSQAAPVVGDFNGDGNLDLAVLDVSGDVKVWLGDGGGGFTPANRPIPNTGAVQGNMAVGDFNGDGSLDLAIADGVSNVIVLFGDGQGGFITPAAQLPVGLAPYTLAVADFNLDGKPDIAVTLAESGAVAMLLGDGTGGFKPATGAPAGTFSDGISESPGQIAVGDFDGDGIPDLAATLYNALGSVLILHSDGNGGLTSVSAYLVGNFPFALVIADFNNDGNLDVAVPDSYNNTVVVLFGDGHGGLTRDSYGPFNVGSDPQTLSAGDFNGDGIPDLATGNSISGNATVLLGSTSGAFRPAPYSPVATGNGPSIVAADFNGDGYLDLVANNYFDNTLNVMLATGGLTISVSSGTLTVGQLGTYTLTVTNAAAAQASGIVTVTDTFPAGLTPVAASGNGWNCVVAQTVSCTRSDGLGAGTSYAPITVTVETTGIACPAATNLAQLTASSHATGSAVTQISGCITESVIVSSLIVGRAATYTLSAAPATGAILAGATITFLIPTGLTASNWGGQGWTCSSTIVSCTYTGEPPGGKYPPIIVGVVVSLAACPESNVLAIVQAAGGPQDTIPLRAGGINGCLTLDPSSVTFPQAGLYSQQQIIVTITSISELTEVFSRIELQNFGESFGYLPSCQGNPNDQTLRVGGSCQVTIFSMPQCVGTASATLVVSTVSGATFSVPISATGVAAGLSLTVDGKPLGTSTLSPGPTYVLGLTVMPLKQGIATCAEPTLSFSFVPANKDPGYSGPYDSALSNNTLTAGTVAGTISLQTQVEGMNVTAQDGTGLFNLALPLLAGTVTALSVSDQTSSSFQVNVTAFSTPRGNGAASSVANSIGGTEVCVALLPASGGKVSDNATACALEQDIEIWYQRNLSYQYGSQFQAGLVFPFSGDTGAIGVVKAWIRNEEGDGIPMCVNFKTGAVVSCSN